MKTKIYKVQFIMVIVACCSFLTAVFCYATALCTHQWNGYIGPRSVHNESQANLDHTRIIQNGVCTDVRVGATSDPSACFCNDNSEFPSDC